LSFLHCQSGLDQGGHSGGLFEMSDIGLDRTDRAETAPIRSGSESTSQRVDLQWIADNRSGPMAFDVADVVWRNVGDRHCLDHCSRLTGYARGGVTDLIRSVVVDRGPSDHRINIVMIGDS
jgi:hypothetical protein